MEGGNRQMDFRYAKLRGRIIEKYGTIDAFGDKLKISKVQLSKKMNGRAGFSQADIVQWCKLLDIELSDVGSFFYA